jgi:hypothetical protein
VKKVLSIAFVALLAVFNAVNAQNLVLTLSNSNTETFAVADVRSIKFSPVDMVLTKFDGTVNTWNIADIDNYAFDVVTNVNEATLQITDELGIFPNPSSYQVQINYSSNRIEEIRIDVHDINGRLVEQLFQGNHKAETVLTWNAKQNSMVQAGQYMIKITTSNKIITKPVIIQ